MQRDNGKFSLSLISWNILSICSLFPFYSWTQKLPKWNMMTRSIPLWSLKWNWHQCGCHDTEIQCTSIYQFHRSIPLAYRHTITTTGTYIQVCIVCTDTVSVLHCSDGEMVHSQALVFKILHLFMEFVFDNW